MTTTFDSHKNFSYSTVATAPSPATSGTSLTVATGDGALFPTVPFNATVWPAGQNPLSGSAEVVRVTAIAGDVLTITRAQESSSAQAIAIGYQIAATITAKTITDVETAVAAVTGIKVFDSTLGADTASIDTNPTSLAGYDVLEIYIYARTDEAALTSVINITLNNDSGAKYDLQLIEGKNATLLGSSVLAGTKWQFTSRGSTAGANFFSLLVITIPCYAQTTGYKAGSALESIMDTANPFAHAHALNFRDTAAITRVAVAPNTAGKKLKAGSRLLIYGR